MRPRKVISVIHLSAVSWGGGNFVPRAEVASQGAPPGAKRRISDGVGSAYGAHRAKQLPAVDHALNCVDIQVQLSILGQRRNAASDQLVGSSHSAARLDGQTHVDRLRRGKQLDGETRSSVFRHL